MASFTYSELKTKYEEFAHPLAVVEINGKDISKNQSGFQVSDMEVELNSAVTIVDANKCKMYMKNFL